MSIVVTFAKLLVAVEAIAHPGTAVKLGALAAEWAVVLLLSCPLMLAVTALAVVSVMGAARVARLPAGAAPADPAS